MREIIFGDQNTPEASNVTQILRLDIKSVRSEEHTSELQSPVPISYAVFCLKKKKKSQ